MNLSDNGLKFIKSFEGFSATPYKDTAGKMSIGYGHLMKFGENFDQGISPDQAEVLLAKDVSYAESCVSQYVKVDLTQNEYDALVSFTYNLGGKALAGSTLLKLLNADNFEGAANEFLRWNHVNGKVSAGITRRRQAEKDLFLAPPTWYTIVMH